MNALLTGIGWVTGAGFGCGKEGGGCDFPDQPLPTLTRKDVFPEPNQRFGRMSDYAKLGLAALTFALRDAGLETWSVKRPIGVVAATKLGCLATDLAYHRAVLLEGGGLASPNLFAYTLANCFLGDAAIQFGLTGSLIALNETREGLDALRIALEDLDLGEAETMVVGVCDLAVPETFTGQIQLLPGAAFLVLTTAPVAEDDNRYGTVTLDEQGNMLFDGAAVGSLLELVQSALVRAPLHKGGERGVS